MKIPNGNRAVVDLDKLLKYSLNPDHRFGGHKARVFASLGLTQQDAAALGAMLLESVRESRSARPRERDEWGQRYELDIFLEGPYGSATARSGWIIRPDEDFPRLTTFYVPED